MLTRRITADEVITAYEKLGVTPKRSDCMQCGLAIVMWADGVGPFGFDNRGSLGFEWVDKNLGWDYANGFIDGFDANTNTPLDWIDRRRQGVFDGMAVAEAVFKRWPDGTHACAAGLTP